MEELPPQTRYLDRNGKALAYQLTGRGPNLVIVTDVAGHLDLMWADPAYVRLLTRWSERVRYAMFERLGFGLSDPLSEIRPIEEQADDIIAVMDAAGMEEAVVATLFSSAPGAIIAAARHPDRVTGLNLLCPLVLGWRGAPVEELPGWTAERLADWEARCERMLSRWGTGELLSMFSPGLTTPRVVRAWGLMERASVSPGTMRALLETSALVDVRSVLPLVQARTVILHNGDHPWPAEYFRQAAELIPGAEFRQIPAGRPGMELVSGGFGGSKPRVPPPPRPFAR